VNEVASKDDEIRPEALRHPKGAEDEIVVDAVGIVKVAEESYAISVKRLTEAADRKSEPFRLQPFRFESDRVGADRQAGTRKQRTRDEFTPTDAPRRIAFGKFFRPH
jgi:hypothetical protein